MYHPQIQHNVPIQVNTLTNNVFHKMYHISILFWGRSSIYRYGARVYRCMTVSPGGECTPSNKNWNSSPTFWKENQRILIIKIQFVEVSKNPSSTFNLPCTSCTTVFLIWSVYSSTNGCLTWFCWCYVDNPNTKIQQFTVEKDTQYFLFFSDMHI